MPFDVVVAVVGLLQDGVVGHPAARRLDMAGCRLEEGAVERDGAAAAPLWAAGHGGRYGRWLAALT